jgi:hypothetical protein
MIHVRFEGRSFDLDIETAPLAGRASTDQGLKEIVAAQLDVAVVRLDSYVIDRRPNGDIVVRPEAVYG